jgi:hypothetical protein
MRSTRLASLLASFAEPLGLAALLAGSACSGTAGDPAKSDGGPIDEAGVTPPVPEAGVTPPTGEAGVGAPPIEGGIACASPTPVAPQGPMGQACLGYMQATCKATLAACEADCACASILAACLEGGSEFSSLECLSTGQNVAENNLFLCIDFPSGSPCAATPSPPGDAGTAD